jgi:5'-nucleotidase
MKYAWQDPNHGNRPIIQASCYGQDIGDIELSVDTATKQVTNSSVSVIPTRTLADVDRATEMANPDYGSELHKISAEADAAQEYADIVGKTEIGSVSAPLTRAFTGCEYVDNVYTCPSSAQKDKANDSPIGRLFAQAYKWQAQKTSDEPIDFGVVQAGAVRADIYPNENGKATYSDILSASPFANSLFELQMTGAQIKTMLEQQWLRLTVPDSSSPFEMLSFSDDVSYTLNTNDPNATPGNHVLSIYIHGKPIDMKKVYVVATSSFLATGGDGFLAFKNTIQKDVGFTDTDSLLNYVKEQTASGKGIAPNYAHSSAVVSSEIPQSVKPGQSLKQKVYGVNMTSVGSPRNTEVKVYLDSTGGNVEVSSVVSGSASGNAEVSSVVEGGGSGSAGEVVAGGVMAVGQAPSEVPLGTVSIGSDNIANVDVVVPKSVANGDYTLKYVFTDSGTTILQPLKVASVAPTPTPTPTPTPPTPTPPTPSPTPSPNPPVPAHTGVSLDAAIALLLIFGICGISGVVVVRRKTSTKNMANV